MADDPYAGTGFEKGEGRITEFDRNAGARDAAAWRQIIINSFINFGYYPTESEVAQLIPSAAGVGGSDFGPAAVANYVNMQKAEIERQKNDPLAAFEKKMQDSADLYKNQVQGLYGQLQDVLGSAPKLFGNLTPDQIDTYLAPLKRSFDTQLANVQSVIGSRGLAASSTENAALDATGEQFKESVFQTGLNVGLDSQKNRATAIQNQINALLGLAGGEESLAGGAAKQISSQNLGQSNLIQSLPFFLSQAAKENQLFQKSLDTSGFQNTFDQVTGDIGKGTSAFQNLLQIPAQFQSRPQTPQNPSVGPQTPFNPSGMTQNYDTASTLLA
jgi:hypothetical protein